MYTPAINGLFVSPVYTKSLNRVVPVCEASVMIAVSAEHRKEAIEAVAYAIDQVKCIATIWKKVN